MWRLTINGRPYGEEYLTELKAKEAANRLSFAINGLGWTKCAQ